MELRRNGYLEFRSQDSTERFAWTLTKKGFKAIRDHLPRLKEEGYGSEHFYHDYLVTALHLGDWLIERPEGVMFVSEQDLRRYQRESLPIWVPDTNVHRSDGYWGFPCSNGIIAIAIEVEVNQKHLSAYESVGEYYADQENVRRVLWMVPSLSSAKSIQRKISGAISRNDKIHNFILEKDFLELGWRSPIIAGPEAKQTVAVLLNHMVGRKTIETGTNSTHHLLLDPKKSYVRSAFWQKPSTPLNCQLPPH